MINFIKRAATVLAMAFMITALYATAPDSLVQQVHVPQSASGYIIPDSGAPGTTTVKTVSEANGWTYVSAEQNALDQLRERNAKAMGMKVGTIFGCPDAYVCLYHWINYEGGRWQTWPGNWPNNYCWDLSGSTYTDGYNVNDTSASMIINRDQTALLQLSIYNWVQCQSGGGVAVFNANDPTFRTNLAQSGSGNWYHKFTSLEFYG